MYNVVLALRNRGTYADRPVGLHGTVAEMHNNYNPLIGFFFKRSGVADYCSSCNGQGKRRGLVVVVIVVAVVVAVEVAAAATTATAAVVVILAKATAELAGS